MTVDLIVPDLPHTGTCGKQITLRSNFFPFSNLPIGAVIKYEITIIPQVPPRKNRSIYQIWKNECYSDLITVYDGKHTVLSLSSIPDGSFVVCFYDDGIDGIRRNEADLQRLPQQYQLNIKKIKEIDMSGLACYLNGDISKSPVEEMNVIETVLRHSSPSFYANVGKSFYSPKAALRIDQGVELWQGFFFSVHPTNGSLLINLDVSAGAFHQSGSLLDTVISVLGFKSPANLHLSMSESDRLKLGRYLRNLKVNVTHRGSFRKKFTIIKLTSEGADNTRFTKNDNEDEEQTVAEYFEERYKIKLKYPHLPCVVYENAAGLGFLPIEVCKVVPGQRYIRKLNDAQTAGMIQETCQAPLVRLNKISAGIRIIQPENNENLKHFNIDFSEEMISVNARILPTPSLEYHTESLESSINPQQGSWNLRNKKFVEGIRLISWAVVVFGDEDKYPLDIIQNFFVTVCSVFSTCGIDVKNSTPPMTYANVDGNIENILTDAFIIAENSYHCKPQLVFCILPNTNVSLYAKIKRISDSLLGIVTQCVQGKQVFKPKVQVCANLALKVNVKLGGQNSKLPDSCLPFVKEKPTIILGAELTHPGPGSSAFHSIASLAGSIDSQFCKYGSVVRYQEASIEWIHDLSEMVVDMLKMFYQSTGTKPRRIIMYRNGIIAKRARNIASKELSLIRDALEYLEEGYDPQITFVSVQKRHHAKFFPVQSEFLDKSGNIVPGTLIDSDVTLPGEFDFYLASHPGLQGTSKPSYYHVLHDENYFTADTLQTLTYNICYLYCRATRSISVVPALYYAHLVAIRARYHMSATIGIAPNQNADQSLDLANEYQIGGSKGVSYLTSMNASHVLKEELLNTMYFM